jgi:hypothetical protein
LRTCSFSSRYSRRKRFWFGGRVPQAWGVERAVYKWKAKFGGLDVSDARRPKALEDENAKLKKLLAETMLDIAILKDINSRKW